MGHSKENMRGSALQLVGMMLLLVAVIGVHQYSVPLHLFQTFAGEYRDIVGTALFFEEDPAPPGGDPVFTSIPEHQLRYVCKTHKALHMSRVFLKRRDLPENMVAKCGAEDDAGLDPEVGTVGNSAGKSQQNGFRHVHDSSSDNLMIKVEEFPPLPSTEKKHETRRPEPEPVAGPSWMSDLPDDDARILGTLMEATASKSVTREMSRLVEKQIQITDDSIRNIVTDSDSVSDG
jgi:hypothetical protein